MVYPLESGQPARSHVFKENGLRAHILNSKHKTELGHELSKPSTTDIFQQGYTSYRFHKHPKERHQLETKCSNIITGRKEHKTMSTYPFMMLAAVEIATGF